MQYELDGHQEDYRSLTHEYWCDLLSTIEFKDNSKRAETQIKKIASDKAASLYDSDISVGIPRKKKSRLGAGVLRYNRGSHNKVPNHRGTQCHCMLCKKAGINEQKYMLHRAEDCFGECNNQKTIKDGLGGPVGSRYEAVKQYKKSEIKWIK